MLPCGRSAFWTYGRAAAMVGEGAKAARGADQPGRAQRCVGRHWLAARWGVAPHPSSPSIRRPARLWRRVRYDFHRLRSGAGVGRVDLRGQIDQRLTPKGVRTDGASHPQPSLRSPQRTPKLELFRTPVCLSAALKNSNLGGL